MGGDPPQSGDAAEAEILPQLEPQGRLWRSLLSGEKRATDLLGQSDYLAAGERVLDERRRARAALPAPLPWRCIGVARW